MDILIAHIDGSCKGGRLGIGGILSRQDGTAVASFSRRAGHGQSLDAEYAAALEAIDLAVAIGARKIIVHTDNRHLSELTDEAFRLRRGQARHAEALRRYTARAAIEIEMVWIPRENNQHADRLAGRA